jgi:hypothetical protein
MHLIGTNLCIWLRIITLEIVREMHRHLPEAILGSGFHEAIGYVYNTQSHEQIVVTLADGRMNNSTIEG